MTQGLVQDWGSAVQTALQDAVRTILGFLPNLIGALVIVIVGIIIGVIVGKIIERISQLLRLDSLFERFGIKRSFERVGLRLSIAKILGGLVRWFVYVVAFLAAATALQLKELSLFINSLLMYIPNVIVAVLILVVGVLLAHFLAEIVLGAAEGAKFYASHFVAAVTKYSIIIFSILAALVQLGIATSLVQTLFTAIVGAIAIAAGIAFGLGGQGVAREILEKIKRDLESR